MSKNRKQRKRGLSQSQVLSLFLNDGIAALEKAMESDSISRSVLLALLKKQGDSKNALAEFCREHTRKLGRPIPEVDKEVPYKAQVKERGHPRLSVPLHYMGKVKQGDEFLVKFKSNQTITIRRPA